MSRISDAATVERGPFEMIPHWMLDHGLSGKAIHLWLVLRKHGDESRTSFPGRGRLAEILGVSKPTITRLVDELAGHGALCFKQRMSEYGDYSSNEYHIHWIENDKCRWFTDGLGGTSVDHPSTPVDQGGPPVMSIKRLTKRDLLKEESSFDEFWSVYPKRVARKKALQSWLVALKENDPQMLINAARSYRDDPKRLPEFTLHPTTWLNQERWLDEPAVKPAPSRPVTFMEQVAEPCEHGDPRGSGSCALCRRSS